MHELDDHVCVYYKVLQRGEGTECRCNLLSRRIRDPVKSAGRGIVEPVLTETLVLVPSSL